MSDILKNSFLSVNPEELILFFDGHCNLCSGFAHFVMARDKKQVIKLAPLQSSLARDFLPENLTNPSKLDTVVCLYQGKIHTKSSAALTIIQRLPGWSWVGSFWILPEFLRDLVYDLVGRNRYKLFGKRDACVIISLDRVISVELNDKT